LGRICGGPRLLEQLVQSLEGRRVDRRDLQTAEEQRPVVHRLLGNEDARPQAGDGIRAAEEGLQGLTGLVGDLSK